MDKQELIYIKEELEELRDRFHNELYSFNMTDDRVKDLDYHYLELDSIIFRLHNELKENGT